MPMVRVEIDAGKRPVHWLRADNGRGRGWFAACGAERPKWHGPHRYISATGLMLSCDVCRHKLHQYLTERERNQNDQGELFYP
jgi:hypothetical protein